MGVLANSDLLRHRGQADELGMTAACGPFEYGHVCERAYSAVDHDPEPADAGLVLVRHAGIDRTDALNCGGGWILPGKNARPPLHWSPTEPRMAVDSGADQAVVR